MNKFVDGHNLYLHFSEMTHNKCVEDHCSVFSFQKQRYSHAAGSSTQKYSSHIYMNTFWFDCKAMLHVNTPSETSVIQFANK